MCGIPIPSRFCNSVSQWDVTSHDNYARGRFPFRRCSSHQGGVISGDKSKAGRGQDRQKASVEAAYLCCRRIWASTLVIDGGRALRPQSPAGDPLGEHSGGKKHVREMEDLHRSRPAGEARVNSRFADARGSMRRGRATGAQSCVEKRSQSAPRSRRPVLVQHVAGNCPALPRLATACNNSMGLESLLATVGVVFILSLSSVVAEPATLPFTDCFSGDISHKVQISTVYGQTLSDRYFNLTIIGNTSFQIVSASNNTNEPVASECHFNSPVL